MTFNCTSSIIQFKHSDSIIHIPRIIKKNPECNAEILAHLSRLYEFAEKKNLFT